MTSNVNPLTLTLVKALHPWQASLLLTSRKEDTMEMRITASVAEAMRFISQLTFTNMAFTKPELTSPDWQWPHRKLPSHIYSSSIDRNDNGSVWNLRRTVTFSIKDEIVARVHLIGMKTDANPTFWGVHQVIYLTHLDKRNDPDCWKNITFELFALA